MFCFSFVCWDHLCSGGLSHTCAIFITICRAHYCLTWYFDPFTPSPISFFSIILFVQQSVFLFVSRPKINIILCVSLKISLSSLLVYMSFFPHFFFSSQDYEILRWFQVNIKEKMDLLSAEWYSSFSYNNLFIYFPTNKLLGVSKSSPLQTILQEHTHTFLWGPGQECLWAQHPWVQGCRINWSIFHFIPLQSASQKDYTH